MAQAWRVVAAIAGACLGATASLTCAAAPPTASIEQHSSGPCSPPVVNNSGQVDIVCTNIDPQALQYLEARLTELLRDHLTESNQTARNLNDSIDRLRQEADDWARRYHELQERLANSPDQGPLLREARDLIRRGEFDRVEAMLQELAAREEPAVLRAAAIQYYLGNLEMLRFASAQALPHFEKAFRYSPDNFLYADGYARAAYQEQNFADAERGWRAALKLLRDLADRNPEAYRPNVATILTSFGILLTNTGRPMEAEIAYGEALAIFRELAPHNPSTYQPSVAMVLNNLGNLRKNTEKVIEAENAYIEALFIYRLLVIRHPDTYLPDVAMALNNLAIVLGATDRIREADFAYAEALAIYNKLADHTPEAYKSSVAVTLNNRGTLLSGMGRQEEGEAAYTEALNIYRKLAARNRGPYRSYIADTLTNLGILHKDRNRMVEAKAAYTEALAIYRALEPGNPRIYTPRITKLSAALDLLAQASPTQPK